nr:nickel pincer cofactor biosynthesis protein LarB [Candidatus Baldrarchaeota archaeon]
MREVLRRLVKGEISIEEAEKLLKITAIEEIETIAKLDVKRHMRTGVPEIILAEGKDPQDLVKIVMKTLEKSGRTIISRIENKHVEAIKKIIPSSASVQINKKARMIVIKKGDFAIEKTGGKVGIITAGTSDIPVAEEAKIIAEEMGCEVFTAYDVGVAGIHRLFPSLKKMIEKDIDVLIVVAGREGALPSVVAGMVDIPVIGVPTSIGYGLGEKGISALTAMLQACSLGLAVVNIDGGVAAGAVAALIANRVAKARGTK